jgi:hypothetical protein
MFEPMPLFFDASAGHQSLLTGHQVRSDLREKDHVPKDKSVVGRPEQDGHCANGVELRDGGSALRRLLDVGI